MRIIYLDLDTLRPDHLGCYGYQRNTSPNIDQVAEDGVRFDNYYCSDAPCLPSRTALTSGQFGIHTGVVGHGGTAAERRGEGSERDFESRWSEENLPGFLSDQGLTTVTISPFAERHGAWHFYAGFDEMYNTGQKGWESAEEITPQVLDWLADRGAEDDWFLHINYWDPHTPYRAPEEFGNPFADSPLPDWLDEEILAEHRELVGPHKPREINMYDNQTDPQYPRQPGELEDLEDLREMIDGYDCGIRYLDQHIGKILAALEEQGIREEVAIIISADHGENMGELGIYGEHGTADYATCRIPLIIDWPGKGQGEVNEALHYNLDLAPTLAELLDSEPKEVWDGTSFASAVKPDKKAEGRDYLVLSQCAHVCQRSVRFGPWLYMRTYHDGYHLFPQEMLFNVEADPHEQKNLAEERPDICKKAVYLLQEWQEEMMASMPHNYIEDPLWRVMAEGGPFHAQGALEDYCEYLQKTDREWAIPELKERHPEEFTD